MSNRETASTGRYLLFLDILGFSDLVSEKGQDDVLRIITNAIEYFHRWEGLNRNFKTIYFADTFLFYQENEGYHDSHFMDIYALSSFVLTALLSEGIPARGAISFGEFHVHEGVADRHQVYFGRALIEAHKAEQNENWIGITILPSAWRVFDKKNAGVISSFEAEKVWRHRERDDCLLLNPFVKMRGWHLQDLIGEIDYPYMEWDRPEFPNEIKAFGYLLEKTQEFVDAGDFTSRVASKYMATNLFLQEVLGEEMYQWACDVWSKVKNDIAGSV